MKCSKCSGKGYIIENELTEDVSDHIWRVLGNACHYILSKTKQEGRLIEEKIVQEVDGITIVGVLDLYDDINKGLDDWKTTSIWSLKLGDKEAWEIQLNCYAWLLRRCGFEVKYLGINAIIKDWRRGERLKYDDYPPIPFQRVSVKLWTFDEQEKFIKERVRIYKEALSLSEDKLPICTPKERWAKEDSFAVYKIYKGKKNKIASRVLPTLEKANAWIANQSVEVGKIMEITKRKGSDMKCESYCLVNKFCSYYKGLKK